jgi:site-specific DNA-methyltransferase (adenine-specific)
MEYFPQGLIEINKTRKVDKKDGTFLGARKNQDGKQYVQKYKNYPQSIIMFSRDRGLHPTQKPVALLEYLIRTYTEEGNTVLDFTMGSGSTGVACINTNRNYIGFELDKHYCDIANERIQKALAEKEVGE